MFEQAAFEDKKRAYMPILAERQIEWENWVKINNDPYGKTCVDVARRVMELLDEHHESAPLDTYALISKAENENGAGGITGFMAGYVAQMVSRCHSRGEEFRRAWNLDNQIHEEGKEINESGGVINPAILTIEFEVRNTGK